jgi:P2 family phage contractile tail tube protein
MSSTFFVMESCNLFCGDHDPSLSKHLTLAELKIPDLQEIYEDHHAGGARFQVEVELGVQKLEPTFKLNGWDPDLLAQFGLGSRKKHVYTAYGAIRDKRSGAVITAKAVIEARLGKVAPDAFERGSLQGHEYALNEVFHYELYWNDVEKYYFDWFTSTWRVNGADENAEINRALRIG